MTSESVPVRQQALETLLTMMPDRVFLPGDPSWEQVRLPWALAVDQRPIAVVEARDVADVVRTVRVAAGAGLSVAPQPVGHGATTALNGAIILRTRELAGIEIDAAARIARVGAGVKWGEVLAELRGSGLVPLVGSNPDPTVAGYILGGGVSWFSRKYGVAANSVTAFELVDAFGQQLRVTQDSDPDLFWALRGGGGDFGIVTAVEFALYPEPEIYGGQLMWPMSLAGDVLRAFRDLTLVAPDELTAWAHLIRFPPIEDLPEFLRGQSFVTVSLTYLGTAEAAEELLKPLRLLPEPMGGLASVPVEALGALNNEPVDPMPALDSCSGLTELSDEVIDTLLSLQGPGVESPLMMVQIRHCGGALARTRPNDGATPPLEAPYLLFSFGVPMVPELVPAIRGSQGRLAAALAGHLNGAAPFNFVDDLQVERVFPPQTLARLRAIKEQRDPSGVFRSNRPVRGGE